MDGVQYDPARGVVHVGGDTFEATVADAAELEVAGRRLRPLTLAERELVIDLVGGAHDDVDAVALTVAKLATVSGDVGSTAERLATEAVALHLAGADMSGALAVSSFVARRSLGAEAGGVAAIEADRLADAVARVHGEDAHESGESGWTTISYDGPAAAPGASVLPRAGPREVRDEYVRALLGRANASVPTGLARWLLEPDTIAGGDEMDPPGGWPDTRTRPAPAPEEPETAAPEVERDRWGARAEAPTRAQPPSGAFGESRPPVEAMSGGRVPAARDDRGRLDAGASGGATASEPPAAGSVPASSAATASPAGPGTRPWPGDHVHHYPGTPDAAAGVSSTGARSAGRARPSPAPAWRPSAAGHRAVEAAGTPRPVAAARRSEWGPDHRPPAPAAVPDSRGSAAAEAEGLAAALHRAADARGVPR